MLSNTAGGFEEHSSLRRDAYAPELREDTLLKYRQHLGVSIFAENAGIRIRTRYCYWHHQAEF